MQIRFLKASNKEMAIITQPLVLRRLFSSTIRFLKDHSFAVSRRAESWTKQGNIWKFEECDVGCRNLRTYVINGLQHGKYF